MSNCQELLIIFDRISQRVDKGAENYSAIVKYITHRIEAEEKFSAQLKQLIPSSFDASDSLTNSFFKDLRSEAEQHAAFASDLRKKVVTPANPYMSTMREKQKRLQTTLRNQKQIVQKALSDTERAQKEVDFQRAKCNGLSGAQLTKQQQRVFKATQDYQNKSKVENQTAQNVSSSQIPTIHREFSEYDSTRLANLQKVASNFVQMKKTHIETLLSGANITETKIDGVDTKDRSDRLVGRIFDPSSTTLQDEDQDLRAVAIADYKSNDERDLQFERGDRIRVIGQHHSGWWEGELEGKKGYFPKTFVMLPGDVDLRKDPIGAVFLVKDDYSKAKGGDISLLTGDLVYVDYLSKDRCSGTNIRDKKRGYFPLECLECTIETTPPPQEKPEKNAKANKRTKTEK